MTSPDEMPAVGDRIQMAAMGDDVFIEVAVVPAAQPLIDTDDCLLIVDQYGEEHIVEREGDGWVTTQPSSLSIEGSAAYTDRHSASATPRP